MSIFININDHGRTDVLCMYCTVCQTWRCCAGAGVDLPLTFLICSNLEYTSIYSY